MGLKGKLLKEVMVVVKVIFALNLTMDAFIKCKWYFNCEEI
jgi:hypothetical protein